MKKKHSPPIKLNQIFIMFFSTFLLPQHNFVGAGEGTCKWRQSPSRPLRPVHSWKGWKLDMFLEAQQTVYQIIHCQKSFLGGEGIIPKSLGRLIVCDFCFGLSLGKIWPSEPPSASSNWKIGGRVITVPRPHTKTKSP